MNSIPMRGKRLGPAPSYANAYAAGLDLRVRLEKPLHLEPGQRCRLFTGVCLEIPAGYFGMVVIRSGLGFRGLVLSNGVGIIDEDYRGEIQMVVHHHGEEAIDLVDGERVAQIIFVPYRQGEIEWVEALSETSRGEQGMGSSGRF